MHISALRLISFGLCLYFLPLLAWGQTCELYTGTDCEPFVPAGTWIFVPNDGKNATLEKMVRTLVTNMRFPNVILSGQCRDDTLRWYCTTFLRPCVQYDNVTIPLPVDYCEDICTQFVSNCADTFASFHAPLGFGGFTPSLPIHCNDTDPYNNGLPTYPAYNNTYPIPGVGNVTIPCIRSPLQHRAPLKCDPPLVPDYDSISCGLPCPAPSFTEDEYDSAKTMLTVMGWLSWVSTLPLMASYISMPHYREFPKNLILMCVIAVNILSGGLVMPTYAGFEDIWCGGQQVWDAKIVPLFVGGVPRPYASNTEDIIFHSIPCTLQGAIILFGYLSSIFWWSIISFNLCFEVIAMHWVEVNSIGWLKWARIAIYHALGWVVPLLSAIIVSAANRMAFESSATYCFISPEDENAWQIAFWFIPSGVALLLGLVSLLVALCLLVYRAIKIRKIHKFILMYVRLLLFAGVFFIGSVIIYSYSIQTSVNYTHIQDGLRAYYLCILQGKPNCSLDSDVSNYNLVMLKTFAMCQFGVSMLFIFMNLDILKFYWKSICVAVKAAMNRDASSLRHAFSGYMSRHPTASLETKTTGLSVVSLGEEDNQPEDEDDESDKEDTATMEDGADTDGDVERASTVASESLAPQVADQTVETA